MLLSSANGWEAGGTGFVTQYEDLGPLNEDVFRRCVGKKVDVRSISQSAGDNHHKAGEKFECVSTRRCGVEGV